MKPINKIERLKELVDYFQNKEFFDDFKVFRCSEIRELEWLAEDLGFDHNDYEKLKKDLEET